jgi:hypothetical protein
MLLIGTSAVSALPVNFTWHNFRMVRYSRLTTTLYSAVSSCFCRTPLFHLSAHEELIPLALGAEGLKNRC